ncbi:ADP-ribosylation factor-binding protein GGA3 [Musca vetustissima]|uniref:ADP-ribosylation factor-binding protein GGA3 n=1 Tax=Musca vetustissima TaxID=27455 RepID=UPI002AB6365C|nr:ADP-ribosylation factor-binding protein GGA3 [Musca vetustissima]
MKTDENLLEEMLERSTNPSQVEVDNMAVQIFCMLVNNNKDALVEKAQQLIVDKIKSHNTTEADKAIGLLEECMSKGGEDFQRKTAKFVFLNKLIGLVLDKPTGPPGSLPDPPVPLQTKKRIMECLMLWTVEHADKNKILEAYDNLKKQINFPHGPAASVNNAKSILGKDDLLVAKLLKEGGEENYRKANLVIQHRFNQEARRIEFICHLKSELKKIENTMELLEQMINVYSTEPSSTDDKEIMQSLYSTCEGHNEQMARWPDFLGDSEPDFLSDVLITKDHLFSLLQRYNELINGSDENKYQTKTATTTTNHVIAGSNATPLINTSRSFASASASANSTTSNADILSELLGDTTLNPPTTTPSANNKVDNAKTKADNKNSTLDELTEIFGSIETKNNESTNYPTDLLNNLDLLEPISVFKTKAKMEAENENSTKTTDGGGVETQKQHGFKELREIDKISEELFKKSLQNEQRQATFKKEPEKVTLNDLAKDKMQISLKSQQQQNGNTTTMDCKSNDEPMLMSDITNTDEKKNSLEIENEKPITDCVSIESNEENKTIENNAIKPQPLSSPATVATSSKPLAEIQIDLDQLTPIAEGQRILMDDEDIEVSLNFTSDRPSPHVSVIVMSVVNKSRLPVEDFQFEASVKKPCKVRLLPPTDTRLTPRKPFRPSEPINQVILLMNPTEKAVDVTCIVGYRLGDDPDPVKESIIAKNIPYV